MAVRLRELQEEMDRCRGDMQRQRYAQIEQNRAWSSTASKRIYALDKELKPYFTKKYNFELQRSHAITEAKNAALLELTKLSTEIEQANQRIEFLKNKKSHVCDELQDMFNDEKFPTYRNYVQLTPNEKTTTSHRGYYNDTRFGQDIDLSEQTCREVIAMWRSRIDALEERISVRADSCRQKLAEYDAELESLKASVSFESDLRKRHRELAETSKIVIAQATTKIQADFEQRVAAITTPEIAEKVKELEDLVAKWNSGCGYICSNCYKVEKMERSFSLADYDVKSHDYSSGDGMGGGFYCTRSGY